jgi:hypothetical protein
MVGDVMGAVADARMYAQEPEERTLGNAAWSLFGLAPLMVGATGRRSLLKLDEAVERAHLDRLKRRKNGLFVGAPPGIDTPEKVIKQADEYAARVKESIDAGIKPGYFYGEGADAITRVTDSPVDEANFAMINAITSSEAPVKTNVGWAIQGVEQDAVGLPVRTGKYPTEASEKISMVMAGDNPHVGQKRHLYGTALIPGETGKMENLAPNDRWEIRSFGYPKDSAGEAQHRYMHEVRELARQKLAAEGIELTPTQAQELNWINWRNREMGLPLDPDHLETVQDAIPGYTFQHSWETAPGKNVPEHLAGYGDLNDAERVALHNEMRATIIDEAEKDRLVRAMGGRLQEPAIDGPGVYEGVVSPGTQSRSLIYQTQAGGLSEPSRARVEATEATRGLLLGQDAYAGHSVLPEKVKKRQDLFSVDVGRTITPEEAQRLEGLLPGTGVVPTERGVNLMDFAEGGADFTRAAEDAVRSLGVDLETAVGRFESIYGDLPWQEGKATEAVLDTYRRAPGLEKHANSPEMRRLMGDMADTYRRLKSTRGLAANEKLLSVLDTWAAEGLKGVRRLVDSGAAPAFVLGLPYLAARTSREQEETWAQ